MLELINDDMLDNVSGGAENSTSSGYVPKDDILKQIQEIQERIRTETNPTTLMKLNAELKRLQMLYDHMR